MFLNCSNGNKFVLKRDFEGKNSSKVFLYHCDIDKVENCEGLKLTAKKSNSENLSDIILKKIDLDKVELLGNKKTGENCYLSLRLLLNFILINEVSIIQVNSPIYKNGYNRF